MASYGEQLRAARKGLTLRQKDIAARCGISQQYLCDLEHDRRLPSRAVERALHAVLGVTCEAFPERAFVAGYRAALLAGLRHNERGTAIPLPDEALALWSVREE